MPTRVSQSAGIFASLADRPVGKGVERKSEELVSALANAAAIAKFPKRGVV
jgi:hypothetical protein